MNQVGLTAANSAEMGLRYAKRLAEGISAERFARLPCVDGTTVQSNHPAFIVGHLCLYPTKVLGLLGLDIAPVLPPDGYEEVFSKTAQCVDDPEGAIYPPRDELLETYLRTYRIAIDALRDASDEQLAAQNPVDSPMQSVLPTLGCLLSFYMNGHVMMHLGQWSAWRRMEGLAPA